MTDPCSSSSNKHERFFAKFLNENVSSRWQAVVAAGGGGDSGGSGGGVRTGED